MGRTIFTLAILAGTMALTGACDGVLITWSNIHSPAEGGARPALDYCYRPLPGTSAFGPVDLSKGTLIQLIKAVGDVDAPWAPAVPEFLDPDYTVDDVILDEVHCGYGTFVNPEGTWSRTVNVDAQVNDVLYVRAYNVPKPDVRSTPLPMVSVSTRSWDGWILSHTVQQVVNPLTLYFDDLYLYGVCNRPPKALIDRAGDTVSLSWEPFGSQGYVIQSTDDLASGTWKKVAVTWTDPTWTGENITGVGKRFYRIKEYTCP
jgi:hypothetical protein